MTPTEKELYNEKISGVHALIISSNDMQNEINKTILATLDRIEIQTTKHNGRMTNVEEINKKHQFMIERLTKISKIQNDKGITFLLWFSDKKYRLLLGVLPFYLFTIKEVRDLVFNIVTNLF